MSENNKKAAEETSGSAELEDMISSAIKAKKQNAEKSNERSGADSAAAGSSPDKLPDVKFDAPERPVQFDAVRKKSGRASDSAEKKPKAVAASAAADVPARKDKDASDKVPEKSPQQKRSAQPGGGSPKEKNEANDSKVSDPGADRPAKKEQQDKGRSSGSKAEPEDGNDKKLDNSKAEDSGGSGDGKKKKAIVIGGAIFGIVCLLLLIAFLIFHTFYSMLGGKWKDGSTDERPVIIDDSADPNREVTIDPEEEERRLREQLEKSAVNLMSDGDVFNILLVGEDLRSTAEEERGNTDVMMLISINKKLETITLTSFMRDIYVYLPQYEYSNRLNAAYWHGGPDYLGDVLEQYFGVTIDRYVVVNFNQFITIVDTLGGLELDVTDDEAYAMQEPQDEQNMYLGQPFGTDILKKGGKGLLLNGNQSLAFARIRKGVGDDYGRTQRQRIVIQEMIKKSKELSLVQLNDLLQEVLPNVYTDLEEGETAAMLLNSFDYMKYTVQEVRIPADYTFTEETVYIEGYKSDVLSLDFDANTAILQEAIYGETMVDTDDSSGDEYNGGYYDQWGNWIAE